MSKREIAVLACKILSIYTIIKAITVLFYFAQSFGFFFRGQQEAFRFALWLIGGLLPFVLLIIFGILLWYLSDQLAARMISDTVTSESNPKIVSTHIQAIAFSVIGLFVLAEALPRLTRIIIALSIRPLNMQNQQLIHADKIAQIGALFVQLAIGFWLLLGSRRLVNILKTVREAGVRNLENIPE